MFLKLIRYSYSSGCKSFACQPFSLRTLFALVQEFAKRCENVVIENQDFETLIKHYDRPTTFTYCDPPYFTSEYVYDCGFTWEDHLRLYHALAGMKGKFLLSYNDCPEIRELYKEYNFFDFKRVHTMSAAIRGSSIYSLPMQGGCGISLRREDAERLGYDNGSRWRDMLRSQTQTLSENLKIPMSNLRWFAAFHNESYHPHVHMIVYSTDPTEGYLSEKGVMALRSSFAKDIFAQDLLCEYKKQTEHRDALKVQSREVLAELIAKINGGTYDNPQVEDLLQTLAKRLAVTNGKKQYGYLRKDIKEIINSIVDELGKDERIAALYD